MSLESPPVGWPVQFYPTGDANHPHAATVTERGMAGQVKLNFQHVGGGELQSSGKFVRHIDDPWVKANASIVQKMGCWGWVPGLVHQPEAKPETDDRKQQGIERARELASEGLDIDDIAKKVRGFGLNRAEVEELLTQPVG